MSQAAPSFSPIITPAWQRQRLPLVPLPQLLRIWDEQDKQGQDLRAIRTLCLADRFYLLVKVLNRWDALRDWVYARCREVENDPDGYLDLWAREHYKSTIITYAGAIQEILRDPEITIAIFSHSKPIAKAFLRQIQRELESNELLKTAFPEILWDNPDREAPLWSLDDGIVVKRRGNPKESTVEAHGLVDGQPTSRHFRLRIYNDVVTRESVNTPEQIEKTTAAWSLSDNLGAIGGRVWYEGTRYNFNDTYQVIMDRGAAKPRVYAATHDGLLSGRPVLLSVPEWELKKINQLEADIACQQLMNPLAGTQRMFDPENLRTYQVRPPLLMCYITIDPARSKKKNSANTAMAVQGIDVNGGKYLLDGFDHKMDLQERWENMRDLRNKWVRSPGILGVKVGYETYGAQADMDYFVERMRLEGNHFEIAELEWPNDSPGSKDDRVQRLGPDLKMHAYFLPHPTDEDELTDEQVRAINAGYSYRISRKILQRNEHGLEYDLAERLRMQVGFYPFTGLKDLIDAVARIYDLDPRPPSAIDSGPIEPDEV
jgi:hypothetical protein